MGRIGYREPENMVSIPYWLLPKLLRPFRADIDTVYLPGALPRAYYVSPLRDTFIQNGPERTELFQPRAAPWDIDPNECSPVRATQRYAPEGLANNPHGENLY